MEASSSSPAESICTCAEIVLRDETVSCFKLVVEKESILKCLLMCTSVHVQSSSLFRSEPWSRFETPVVNIVPGWGEESKVASQSGRVFFFFETVKQMRLVLFLFGSHAVGHVVKCPRSHTVVRDIASHTSVHSAEPRFDGPCSLA